MINKTTSTCTTENGFAQVPKADSNLMSTQLQYQLYPPVLHGHTPILQHPPHEPGFIQSSLRIELVHLFQKQVPTIVGIEFKKCLCDV
jgi:hypothetical protein